MKKLFYWTLFVFVSIAFNSCSLFGEGGKSNDPNFQISDLQGLWEENHTQHYVRFTADRAEEYPYFYGREWDEGGCNGAGSLGYLDPVRYSRQRMVSIQI